MGDSVSLAESLRFVPILTGFIVIFVVIGLLFSLANDKKQIRGESAMIIGPFPIVFRTDRKFARLPLILSIILIALVLLRYWFNCL